MEQKQLQPLGEFNEEVAASYKERDTYPKLNRLACPKCEGELMDSDSSILTSYPAQRKVQCSRCDYRGYRLA